MRREIVELCPLRLSQLAVSLFSVPALKVGKSRNAVLLETRTFVTGLRGEFGARMQEMKLRGSIVELFIKASDRETQRQVRPRLMDRPTSSRLVCNTN